MILSPRWQFIALCFFQEFVFWWLHDSWQPGKNLRWGHGSITINSADGRVSLAVREKNILKTLPPCVPFPHLLVDGLTSKGERKYSQLPFSLERKGRFSLSGNRGIISMGEVKSVYGILGNFCACGLEWIVSYCACFDQFLIVCFSLLDILMNSIRWARHLCHLSCSSLPSNTSRESRACWSRTTDMRFLSVSRLTKRTWWCKTRKQSNNLHFFV